MQLSKNKKHSFGNILFEVLVSLVASAVAITVFFNLLEVMGKESLKAVWRQQAVMVLHGHLSRVVNYYRRGLAFTVNSQTNNYPKLHPDQFHSIFLTAPGQLIRATEESFVEGGIFYHRVSEGQSSLGDRNVVWLDYPNKVTAQLSWTLDAAGQNLCYDGASGAPCQELTAYLDFPYRWQGEMAPLVSMDMPVETIFIKTIVGKF